uniref:Uncharacterized protein n=1 Tax=viral metagenome TaxID=1070528 RepID=A0A6M3M2J8_9ZZZZ
MDIEQIKACCQALGYAMKYSSSDINDINVTISEFWHALNRETASREKQVPNELVDRAVEHTKEWLNWHKSASLFVPEW